MPSHHLPMTFGQDGVRGRAFSSPPFPSSSPDGALIATDGLPMTCCFVRSALLEMERIFITLESELTETSTLVDQLLQTVDKYGEMEGSLHT